MRIPISKRVFFSTAAALLIVVAVLLGAERQSKRHDLLTHNFAIKVAEVSKFKPLVVIVPSYNNSEYVEENLGSVLSQVYPNFRVIYINDASTDDTADKVESVVNRSAAKSRIEVWNNPRNLGALANIYRACHSCKNDEIVVIVDGDDQLKHCNVLKELNEYYNNPDTWVTYGSYEEAPSGFIGVHSKPINIQTLKSGRIKYKSWMTSHLKTFYAGLFKSIALRDMMHNGEFFQMGADVATMLPIIEMAREHTVYIRDVLYIYNLMNPSNDHKKSADMQQVCEKMIRSKPVYARLETHPAEIKDMTETDTVDIVVFSFNRPLQLFAFLESLQKYGKNYKNVSVICRSSHPRFERGYAKVEQAFPDVKLVRQSQKKVKAFSQFKPMVMQQVFDPEISDSKYILFSTDDIIIKDDIDFREGIAAMNQTKAHGLFYRLGRNIDTCYMTSEHSGVPPLAMVKEGLFAWQYARGNGDWHYPNSVDFTMYRKEDIKPQLESFNFSHPTDLEGIWATKADFNEIGLCYETSKIVNIPVNVVAQNNNRHMDSYSEHDLLKLFLTGKKMDITPLHKINNPSPHIDFNISFIDQ